MLRTTLPATLLLLALAAFAGPAQAVPVDAVLNGSDGNFQFSVIHTSTGGNDGQSGSIIGGIGLGLAGGDWSVVGDVGTLNVQLTVTNNGATDVSTYDATGQFSVSALTSFVDTQTLLGSLTFNQVGGDTGSDATGISGLTFFFEDQNYSSAVNPPNGLDASGTLLTLWGASRGDLRLGLGDSFELPSGTSDGARGIDLRLQIAPIPEPSAKPLYLAGLAIVGFGASRLRQR